MNIHRLSTEFIKLFKALTEVQIQIPEATKSTEMWANDCLTSS